jgi:hypothetical protein
VIAGELSAYLDCWRRLERLLPPVGAGRTRVLQAIGAIPRDADQLAALSQIPASPKAKRRPYRPSLAQVEKTTGKKVSGISYAPDGTRTYTFAGTESPAEVNLFDIEAARLREHKRGGA